MEMKLHILNHSGLTWIEDFESVRLEVYIPRLALKFNDGLFVFYWDFVNRSKRFQVCTWEKSWSAVILGLKLGKVLKSDVCASIFANS